MTKIKEYGNPTMDGMIEIDWMAADEKYKRHACLVQRREAPHDFYWMEYDETDNMAGEGEISEMK
jgi:hypothetical protein